MGWYVLGFFFSVLCLCGSALAIVGTYFVIKNTLKALKS